MKKYLSLLLTLALIFSLAGSAQTVSAATLKLNQTKAKVIKGDYLYLKVSGTKSKVKWSVKDYSIATISNKGKVEGIKIGTTYIIAKVGRKSLKCKITVVPKPHSGYVTDTELEQSLAERNYIDNFSDEKTEDKETVAEPSNNSSAKDAEARIKKMQKYGFSSSEILDTPLGKQYMKFCDTWVSEYELENSYNASVIVSEHDNKLYIIFDADNRIVIENVPDELEAGTIYTISNIKFQYLNNFTYSDDNFTVNQFFFDRQSLINKLLIK